jgi:hypothetical protein
MQPCARRQPPLAHRELLADLNAYHTFKSGDSVFLSRPPPQKMSEPAIDIKILFVVLASFCTVAVVTFSCCTCDQLVVLFALIEQTGATLFVPV